METFIASRNTKLTPMGGNFAKSKLHTYLHSSNLTSGNLFYGGTGKCTELHDVQFYPLQHCL